MEKPTASTALRFGAKIPQDMEGDRLYKFCYSVLRIFHWGMFFVVVEIMGWFAGWMIFGILGNFLAWLLTAASGHDPGQGFLNFFQTAGKGIGMLAGVGAMWFVMGRYINPDNR